MSRRVAAAVAGLCLLSTVLATAIFASPALADPKAPAGSKQAFSITDPEIVESSGLTASNRHPGTFYTINDSGDEARIFAVNEQGETVATLLMRFIEANDWEAIAAAPNQRVWVGDIGDNRRQRERITLYRFREPETLQDQRLQYGRYRFRYPTGAHDAETLLVHPQTGQIYIVTKAISGGAIYAGPAEPATGETNELTKVADAPSMITDGAFLPDGSGVVLRSYGRAFLLDWPSGKVKRQIALPEQPQGESLAIGLDGKRLFVGTEGENSQVWSVPVDGPAPGAVAGSTTPAPSKASGATASPSPEQEGAQEQADDGGLLGGMPLWVPLSVIGIAILAGVAAFPRGRRPASPVRGPRPSGGSGLGSGSGSAARRPSGPPSSSRRPPTR